MLKDLTISLNILSLVCFKNTYFYCSCNRHQGCELNYNLRWWLGPLCQILVYFEISNWTGPGLDWNDYNLANFKQFAFHLYPFLEGCYRVDKRSPEAFSSHYYYLSLGWYTGQKSKVFLKEMIECREDIKKKWRKKYFDFYY